MLNMQPNMAMPPPAPMAPPTHIENGLGASASSTTSRPEAVSSLLERMRNGEISKTEMFQQLAKLQEASRLTPSTMEASSIPGTSPSVSTMAHSSSMTAAPRPIAGQYRPATQNAPEMTERSHSSGQTPYVSFIMSAPTASYSMLGPSATSSGASAAPSTGMSFKSSSGATKVGNDAELLSNGVSHDKAKQFSVQEWMASKMRASESTKAQQKANDLTRHADITTDSAGRGSSTPYQSYQREESFQGVDNDRSPVNQSSSASPYVYTPQRQWDPSTFFQNGNILNGNSAGNGMEQSLESSGHEYIDFSEPYRNEGRDNGTNTMGNGNNRDGNEDGKFHARVTRWKSQKEAIREHMKQQLLQAELDECTFAPKINPKSNKVVARMRGRVSTGCVDDNLNTPQAVSERLYQEADNYKAREELAAKLKAEEEAELQRECTFRPRINKSNPLTEKVRSKYLETTGKPRAQSITPATMEANAKELAECTFQPKVNPISAEMVSAQLYLQQDIYERLSRPCQMSDTASSFRDTRSEDGDSDSRYSGSSMTPRSLRSQDDCYMRTSRRRSLSISQRRAHRQRPSSAGERMSENDKAERARSFASFLERQQFHELARQKRIEMTKQQLQPEHRPSINKKSVMMMENGRRGDFLDRITKYALRKEHDNVRMKSVRVSDPNCTFKPRINVTSAKRQGRSVTELSRGDLLRRETTQRLMKLKMEQEEMAALTFRPQLNRVSDRFEGKLKILTSPDTYLQRIQQQTQAHSMKQRRAIQEKELEEFAECTFRPRTIEAPAFVQRIARSVALTKALKERQQHQRKAQERPEWK